MKTITKVHFPYSKSDVNEINERENPRYETLTEAIQDLASKGYTYDFNVIAHEDCLVCHKSKLTLSPDEFQIDSTYRFEGDTDPGDEMILFAISSSKHNVKGIVVNAFGIYEDSESSEIVEKLHEKSKIKKPIKRHQALVQLSRDHHFGLLLVWKIRYGLKNSIETERIKNYIRFFFEEDLKEHFQEEERNLFSKLPKDNPYYLQAMDEHQEIYKLIEEMESGTNRKSLVEEFANILEKHIRFEERTLFNYLQTKLSTEELNNLYSEESTKATTDDRWNDHFWTSKN